jgi:Mn-dependent DtxR family transcriptional regulator
MSGCGKVMCQHGYRSLSIYEVLSKHPKGLRVRDVAKVLKVDVSLACRYLKLLEKSGLVVSMQGCRVTSEAGNAPVFYRLVS